MKNSEIERHLIDIEVALRNVQRDVQTLEARLVGPNLMNLLTPTEAAKFLRISVVALRRRVQRGTLKCVRLGRSLRFRLEDLDI